MKPVFKALLLLLLVVNYYYRENQYWHMIFQHAGVWLIHRLNKDIGLN